MTVVRDTIVQSMRSHGMTNYVGQAEPVLRDVEQAAERLADDLIETASRNGMPRDRVTQILIDKGLKPAPAQTAQAQGGDAEPAWFTRFRTQQFEPVMQFARQQGYRG